MDQMDLQADLQKVSTKLASLDDELKFFKEEENILREESFRGLRELEEIAEKYTQKGDQEGQFFMDQLMEYETANRHMQFRLDEQFDELKVAQKKLTDQQEDLLWAQKRQALKEEEKKEWA